MVLRQNKILHLLPGSIIVLRVRELSCTFLLLLGIAINVESPLTSVRDL